VRPQVTVTIELASLLDHTGLPGGEGSWVGPLPAATARRWACDAAVTRVLVARRHHHHDHHDDHPSQHTRRGRAATPTATRPPGWPPGCAPP
jgi:hypothetical protein